jgi:hypothetical protein
MAVETVRARPVTAVNTVYSCDAQARQTTFTRSGWSTDRWPLPIGATVMPSTRGCDQGASPVEIPILPPAPNVPAWEGSNGTARRVRGEPTSSLLDLLEQRSPGREELAPTYCPVNVVVSRKPLKSFLVISE